ncbi:phosphoglycerate mutase family protein, partial [Pseudomonas aeruginosa]
MSIYLVRHGQTEFNAVRRWQGQVDSPLTELGRQQAMRMGRRL